MKSDTDGLSIVADPPPQPPAPPIAEPTSSEVIVKTVISIGLPVVAVLFLAFFAVEWLSFNHPDLEKVVIAGFGALFGAAMTELGHYTGSQNTVSSLNAGVGLEPVRRV